MGWSEAFEEECELSQSTDQQAAEACDSRSDSGSESRVRESRDVSTCGSTANATSACEDSGSVVAVHSGLALWWVQKLHLASRALGAQPLLSAQRRGTLTVVSSCTGCSAESAVLKAGLHSD